MNALKSIIMILIFPASVLLTTLVAADTTSLASAAAHKQAGGEYVRKRFLKRMKKPFDDGTKKKLLIIGDSHAQDFFNGVLENGYLKHYQIRTRYIPTRCQIFLDRDMMRFIKPADKALCAQSDNLQHAKNQISEANTIILVASWREWSARALKQTIANMQLNPQQRLVVIGRKSFSKAALVGQKLSRKNLRQLRNQVDAHQIVINQLMAESLDDKVFINLHQLVCGSLETCPVFTPDLQQISFDGGHFSQAGARYVTRLLFEHSLLGHL